MISDFLKSFFGWIGRTFFNLLSTCGVTPNQITWAGFGLVALSCFFYTIHQDTYFFGLSLALSYTFDALDGAVARRQGTTSKFGGYLDSVIDRYQEIAAYFVLGLVNGWWLVTFILTTGCMLVSYNKAAAAIQIQIDNKSWPDLMERPRRMWLFCAALILDNTIPVPEALGGRFIYVALWYIAILTHFTALQRFVRARRLIVAQEELERSSTPD